NDDNDPFLPATPVRVFQNVLEYITASFPVVSLDQIADGTAWQHPYSVAFTFDDGYRDNFLNAFPLLKQRGVPATIFLAAGFLDRRELPWYDRVGLSFKLTQREALDLSELEGPAGELRSRAEKLQMLERVLWWMRRTDEELRAQGMRE